MIQRAAASLAAVVIFGIPCGLPAEDPSRLPAPVGPWPQFRGPGGAGVSEARGLPEAWSATENVAWKARVPGRGWSSPIVQGGRIFLTTAVSEGEEEAAKKGLYLGGDRQKPSKNRHRWLVLAFDLESGGALWQAEARAGIPAQPRHIKNSHASETCATDGERVYALFGGIGLFAYDLEGKPAWSRPLEGRKMRAGWGTAASPVVCDGKVIVVHDNEESSFIEAFDAKTGATAWRQERDERSNWSTPFIWKTQERTEVVTTGSGRVRSYGLDGSILWELRGMSSITIPTPVAGHGLLFVSSGFVADSLRPIHAIRPGATGDISLAPGETSGRWVAWSLRDAAPYNPSPLLHGDQIYVLLDRGYLASYDARTGKTVYAPRRISEDAGEFTASPWAHGDKVFCLSEEGDTFVIAAGPEFRMVRKNSVGEMCLATPALADDALILRTASTLYRFRAR